jgi:hypothetical protein
MGQAGERRWEWRFINICCSQVTVLCGQKTTGVLKIRPGKPTMRRRVFNKASLFKTMLYVVTAEKLSTCVDSVVVAVSGDSPACVFFLSTTYPHYGQVVWPGC